MKMDGKQTDMTENNSEATEQSNSQNLDAINCSECGRAISQKSGKCYYCGEADPEALKKVKFAMLDFQQEAALDSDGRNSESARKNVSLIFILTNAITMGIAITGIAKDYYPATYFIILGVTLGILGSLFSKSSLTLLTGALCQAITMFFFANLALKVISKSFIKAGISSFVSLLAFLAVAIITYRIIINKEIEL